MKKSWLEKKSEPSNTTRFGKAINTLWTASGAASMFYWVGWFFAFEGRALPVTGIIGKLLSFGLPIALAVSYVIAKFSGYLKSYPIDAKIQEALDIEAEMKRLERNAIFVKARANLRQLDIESTINYLGLNLALPPVVTRDANTGVPAPVTRLKNRNKRLAIATIAGVMSGYISYYFVGWLATDLLAAVGITLITGNIATYVLFALAMVGAVYFGVKRYAEQSALAKDHESLIGKKEVTLKETKAHEDAIDTLKGKIIANCALANKHKNLSPEVKNLFSSQSLNNVSSDQSELWERLDPRDKKPDVILKKFLLRLRVAIEAAITGVFLARSLFLAGSIVSIFFPVGSVPMLILMSTFGAGWSFISVIRHHASRQQKRDEAFVETCEARLSTARDEYNTLYIQLQAQEQLKAERHWKSNSASTVQSLDSLARQSAGQQLDIRPATRTDSSLSSRSSRESQSYLSSMHASILFKREALPSF